MHRCRYAPSTTGLAHPGTLLAALLCWLDARSRGAHLILRLEDLDPQRSRPDLVARMHTDLGWFGLDWDDVVVQSRRADAHSAALDELQRQGALYPCACSRAQIRAGGRLAPDGGYAYENTCRDRPLPPGGWRACDEPLRARLPDGEIATIDEGGLDLTQAPAHAIGDPIVRRRDGAVAYNLAVVVDDAAHAISRIVRGRDIAASTASQVALQSLLNYPAITYRHHALLLEPHGPKLAKFHGAVDLDRLRATGRYDAPTLCGLLAHAVGLLDGLIAITPRDLLADFDWSCVSPIDRVLEWTGSDLRLWPPHATPSAQSPSPLESNGESPSATPTA